MFEETPKVPYEVKLLVTNFDPLNPFGVFVSVRVCMCVESHVNYYHRGTGVHGPDRKCFEGIGFDRNTHLRILIIDEILCL